MKKDTAKNNTKATLHSVAGFQSSADMKEAMQRKANQRDAERQDSKALRALLLWLLPKIASLRAEVLGAVDDDGAFRRIVAHFSRSLDSFRLAILPSAAKIAASCIRAGYASIEAIDKARGAMSYSRFASLASALNPARALTLRCAKAGMVDFAKLPALYEAIKADFGGLDSSDIERKALSRILGFAVTPEMMKRVKTALAEFTAKTRASVKVADFIEAPTVKTKAKSKPRSIRQTRKPATRNPQAPSASV